jgi:hypothetical protein
VDQKLALADTAPPVEDEVLAAARMQALVESRQLVDAVEEGHSA